MLQSNFHTFPGVHDSSVVFLKIFLKSPDFGRMSIDEVIAIILKENEKLK